ncbi:hypothetical protein QQF64_034025 [Cirrhinus molitorella]|uniref:Uncharacterized protein n=1 Tax=Cirrhinus molitorella TaxID=172907 RepID=A0ABR3MVK7_9TELE
MPRQYIRKTTWGKTPLEEMESAAAEPPDVTMYGPFKTQYSRALDGWMRSNSGKRVSVYQIAGLVNEAFMSTMTPRNITSGFRSTGIFPYNREIFPEEAFAPSIVSDRPNPELQPSTADDLDAPPLHMIHLQMNHPLQIIHSLMLMHPQCMVHMDVPHQLTQMCHVFPANLDMYLLPLPKCPPRTQTKQKRVKTAILTDTPEKQAIEKAYKDRQKKLAGKKQKNNK